MVYNKFYLMPVDGRKSFYGKCYVENHPEYFGQGPEQKLAERLFALVPWWDRDGETMADTITQLEQNPLDIIAWLLDYIEESED